MKVFILLVLVSALLCCCRPVPDETVVIDYDEMDKKYGQTMAEEDEVVNMALYEDDMEELQSDVQWYGEMLVSKSAELCVNYFPRQFIEMIMNERGCKRDVAKGIAISKVEDAFQSLETNYREILAVWTEVPHEITIEKIISSSQLASLKETYGSHGVIIEDAVDIHFTISAGKHKASGEVRLVKMDYGKWEVDITCFGI